MKYKELFSPIKIGNLELKNRLVVPAMGSNLANSDSTISDRLINYWKERAKGGWGLLTTEVVAVDPLGKAIVNQPGLWNDNFIPGFERLFQAIHDEGAMMAVQLHHAGRQTSEFAIGQQPVAPSPVRCPICKEIPRELTAREVYDLIESFGDAAKRAKLAGADAVEIHGAHGYLVAQFMSQDANKRVDEFGGSLENRMKFPVEIIKNIRKKTGGSFPIIFRYSADEIVSGGRGLSEARAIAVMVEKAGADCIHISTGTYGSMQYIVAPSDVAEGYILPDATKVKESVAVPVIGVGRISEPEIAGEEIKSGNVDLVAMGRPSLADPQLPNKIAADKVEEISPCIACNQGCIGSIFSPNKLYLTCLVNPFCGREEELRVEPTDSPKKIAVVGGGPGGLMTAWIAALRGHSVTLYEKDNLPGGQYRIGAIPPAKQTIAKAINFYHNMGKKYGVNFNFGTEATTNTILSEDPDIVVIASGGDPLVPHIKGIDGDKIVTSSDVLLGNVCPGAKVLIVGGGLVGCETADFLSELGHEVTIVEQLSQLAKDVQKSVQYFLFDRISKKNVQVELNCEVVEFLEDGAVVAKDGETKRLTDFDNVVLAMGAKPVNYLKDHLNGKVPEVYTIGDALEPRKAIDAIEEGARLAVKLGEKELVTAGI